MKGYSGRSGDEEERDHPGGDVGGGAAALMERCQVAFQRDL